MPFVANENLTAAFAHHPAGVFRWPVSPGSFNLGHGGSLLIVDGARVDDKPVAEFGLLHSVIFELSAARKLAFPELDIRRVAVEKNGNGHGLASERFVGHGPTLTVEAALCRDEKGSADSP